MSLRSELAGIPFAPGCWPIEAIGKDALEQVVIQRSSAKTETIACDYLACGFHLVPNTELAELLGCRTADGYVQVNDFQQTSQADIFCAGEPTAIGGLDLSLVEGQIAGLSAAGNKSAASDLFKRRKGMRSFARALDKTFALRPELRGLPSAETTVCRCEDVSYSQLRSYDSWRAAKIHTRCGMGPCQGRVCGSATQFLFNWRSDSVRPPVFPARLEHLTGGFSESERSHVTGGYA
ncbi:MAG: FAD-dependent oxidoreductase [Candidatus Angelobacter sp.]